MCCGKESQSKVKGKIRRDMEPDMNSQNEGER